MKMNKTIATNLKRNIRNKSWWIAVISLLLLILQSKGFDVTKYIGADWKTTINTIFTLLALFGISVNTATEPNTEVPTTEPTATTQVQQITQDKLQQIQRILNQ